MGGKESNQTKTNSGDPDQMPHYAVSDLGVHCLPISHKKDFRLKWVKIYESFPNMT